MLTIRVLRDWSDVTPLVDAWWQLLDRCADSQPVLTPTWLGAWWDVYGDSDGRNLCMVAFFEADELVGLAPLLLRRHWYPPGIPFRRLELLATGEAEWEETCSDYVGILAAEGHETEVSTAFVQALTHHVGDWDELMMPMMNGESRLPGLLRSALISQGFAAQLSTAGAAPHIPLPSTWQEYLSSLNSSRRYTIRRTLRDLHGYAGGAENVVFRVADTQATLEVGQHILLELHSERWRREGEHGVFQSRRFTQFHRRVMQGLFDRGKLELGWLEVRGAPLAVLYNIVHDGRVYFYQSGRSVDVPDGVRPGMASHLYALQRAIELGRTDYDFLNGTSRYKRTLSTGIRPLVTLRVVRPCVAATARNFIERSSRALREQVSRVREQLEPRGACAPDASDAGQAALVT
jgi:CelD/BcsL family acetyltransferase involved in cellulose biosynthesis